MHSALYYLDEALEEVCEMHVDQLHVSILARGKICFAEIGPRHDDAIVY